MNSTKSINPSPYQVLKIEEDIIGHAFVSYQKCSLDQSYKSSPMLETLSLEDFQLNYDELEYSTSEGISVWERAASLPRHCNSNSAIEVSVEPKIVYSTLPSSLNLTIQYRNELFGAKIEIYYPWNKPEEDRIFVSEDLISDGQINTLSINLDTSNLNYIRDGFGVNRLFLVKLVNTSGKLINFSFVELIFSEYCPDDATSCF